MDQKNWHDAVLRDLKASSLFKSASERGRLLDSLFFGTIESGKGSIGIYVELYHIDNTVRAVAFMFVAPQNQMYVSTDVVVSESEVNLQGDFITEVYCSAWNVFEITVHIKQEFSRLGDWHILSASAQLNQKSPKFFDFDLQPCSWPDKSRNLLVNAKYYPTGYCVCPNCFGRGSSITMAIPKKYYESGVTGYALYTCNEINGRVACVICNGDGAEYLPWYKNENPNKIGCKLKSGSGIISAS